MVRRSAAALTLAGVLAYPAPAYAVTLEQRLAVLSEFTQPTGLSAAVWRAALDNQHSWADYAFDWSTDLCSGSPDRPLGYDFEMPCRRHDFGYRNYKAVDLFRVNKDHVDSAFLFDMRQVCAEYEGVQGTACERLAWSYYQAVRRLGGFELRPRPSVEPEPRPSLELEPRPSLELEPRPGVEL
jgi:hypothetical protein